MVLDGWKLSIRNGGVQITESICVRGEWYVKSALAGKRGGEVGRILASLVRPY